MAVMATIIARNDVSEDAIYALIKGIFDNQEQIAAGNTKGNELDMEKAVSGISIPFHPGAVKFFTENNITIPEADGAADTAGDAAGDTTPADEAAE